MMSMTPELFWSLISDMRAVCGQDMDASLVWMQEKLIAMGPERAQGFHTIFHAYLDLANQYGLWSAASIMCENGCSDDGFIDFRAWLISQGEEPYLAALANPDSLADVESYGNCQFEEISYVGDRALTILTGKSAYDGITPKEYTKIKEELQQDITFGEGLWYPYEWDEIEIRFPCLCAKYLDPGTVEFKLKNNQTMWLSNNPNIRKARQDGPPRIEDLQHSMRIM